MSDISHQLTVLANDRNIRLDKFLSNYLPDLSRSRIQQLIAESMVHKNGHIITDSAYRVKPADHFTVTIPPAIPSDMQATDIPLQLVYEDEHLLVINKPVGLTVHPGAGNHQDTLANALLYHFKDSLSGIGGVERPGIVHRLDKDTSGLIMIAKHDISHQRLSEMIADRTVKRHYLALCWGILNPKEGTIDAAIGRHPIHRTKMTVTKINSRHAITHYTVLETFPDSQMSLLECRLETGRTHQIRVHLNHIKHPIVGDDTYGGKSYKKRLPQLNDPVNESLAKLHHQALHAYRLSFPHPITHQAMMFEAPVEGAFKALLDSLRLK